MGSWNSSSEERMDRWILGKPLSSRVFRVGLGTGLPLPVRLAAENYVAYPVAPYEFAASPAITVHFDGATAAPIRAAPVAVAIFGFVAAVPVG